MNKQRESGERPASATIFVALLVALATTLAPVHAQDRLLSADFPEMFRVGGLVAPEWALFSERGDLGFDASGNLYVLDEEAFRVVVINPAGELVMTVGQEGEGPGDFRDPTALVVWRDGRFAVADGRQWAIQVFGDGSHDHFARMGTERGPLQALDPKQASRPRGGGFRLFGWEQGGVGSGMGAVSRGSERGNGDFKAGFPG